MYGKVMSDPLLMHKDKYARARAAGYRSGLEVMVATHLKEQGIDFGYEALTIPFVEPEKKRKYTPDVILWTHGIVIELKGMFPTADRQKMILVKDTYPDVDIRILFSNPNARISKQSKTTYAKWCETHGFPYAKSFPKTPFPFAWLSEPVNARSLAAITRLLGE